MKRLNLGQKVTSEFGKLSEGFRRRFLITALSAVTLSAIAACQSPTPPPPEENITVSLMYQDKAGQPIEGALATLTSNSEVIGTRETDENGVISITVPKPPAGSAGALALTRLNTQNYVQTVNTQTDHDLLIEGNLGPDFVGQIPAQDIETGQTAVFDMSQYDHNDDPSVLTSRDPNFTVSGTDVSFQGTSEGTYFTYIVAQDQAESGPTDGLQIDSVLVRVNVTAGNQAPVLTDIPDVSFEQDGSATPYTLDDHVSDETSDSNINWSVTGNTEVNVSVDPGTRQVTYSATPGWFGTETITFTAEDEGLLTTSDDVVVTVNPPGNTSPVVVGIPDASFAEDGSVSPYSLDDHATDDYTSDSNIVWAFTGNTHIDVNIDPGTRTVTYSSATPNWFGSETITFTATDEGGLSASDSATITITPVNDNPVLGDIPDVGFIQDTSLTTAYSLHDFSSDIEDADSLLQFNATGNTNVTVSIDPTTRQITYGATPGWIGTETLTFIVTDTDGATATDEVVVTVSPPGNTNPVVGDIPDASFAEGGSTSPYSLDDYVVDAESTDPNISWNATGNTFITVDIDPSTRTVTYGTTDPDWFGSETITFTATDEGGLTDSDNVTITVTPVNDNPVLSPIPDESFLEDTGLTTPYSLNDYSFDTEDPDSLLTWNVFGNSNVSVSINPGTRTVTYGANPNWFGTETITYVVNDTQGGSDSITVDITVDPVNDAPVITDIPDETIFDGIPFTTAYSLDDRIDDLETLDDNIAWTTSGNTNVTVDIDPVTRQITYSASAWTGSELITFRATDEGGLYVEDNVLITVDPAPNQAPNVGDIPDANFNEGATLSPYTLDDYVDDDMTPDASINWTVSGNTNITVDINPGTRTVTYGTTDPDWYGSETITFTAEDEGLLTDSDPAIITVNNVNDAPVFAGPIPNIVIPNGEIGNIDLSLYYSDVDNALSELAESFSGLTDFTTSISGSTMYFAPIGGYVGTNSGVVLTMTDPGSLSAASNAFDVTHQGPPMVNVTFDFREYDGSDISSTVSINDGGTPLGSDPNGAVTVSLVEGQEYDIGSTWAGSIDASQGTEFSFYRGHADEQRARNDQTSPMSFTEDGTVIVYKIPAEFQLAQFRNWMAPNGVLKWDNDPTQWVDLSETAPTSDQRTSLQEIGSQLGMSYLESGTAPTLYVRNRFNSGYTTSNSTTVSGFTITSANINFNTNAPEQDIYEETLEAYFRLGAEATVYLTGSGNSISTNSIFSQHWELWLLVDKGTEF